jgi:ATP/ADP translocase/HEAT repeat protein
MMASLLFFLLAANNVIKVLRDSLFLSRFPVRQLPYVYILTALFAGVLVGIYTRSTVRASPYRLMLGLNLFIIANVMIFWFLIALLHFAWATYAFYIWAAIISALTVAQFWTFAGLIFNSRQAKRLFGILSGCGSLGAILGGFGSRWAVDLFGRSNELFWLIAALFAAAFGVVWLATRELRQPQAAALAEISISSEPTASKQASALAIIRASRYLQLIAGAIFFSVVVSTVIDFQFKVAAKATHPSEDALTAFFGSYYAWVALITFFIQIALTARVLTAFGLIPSLLILPVSLFVGSVGILALPGILSTTATRLTDSVLRTSINQSGMEILYLPLAATIKRRMQTFLDVVLQRLGDGAAGLLVLFYTLFLMRSAALSLGYFSLGLIFIWASFILVLRSGYVEALRTGLQAQSLTWEQGTINYADKETVEAVLQTLQKQDERAVLFGLDLVEKFDPEIILPRLPLSLLQHSSAVVRSRSLKLFATSTDPEKLMEIVRLLEDENGEVQADAINIVCAVRKENALPLMRPYLQSPHPAVQRAAIECLLQHGDAQMREIALTTFREMVANQTMNGAAVRMEAARLMGEVNDSEFSEYLDKFIQEDPSIPVIRQALAAAGRRKDPTLLTSIILRLCCPMTKLWARKALIDYGDSAVTTLREMLLDPRISGDVRRSIPRTLSKIASRESMEALLSSLKEEDGSLRYRVILGLEEMVQRSPNLHADKSLVQAAVISETRRYYRRFLIFWVLFGGASHQLMHEGWLLHRALLENMDREKERVLRLLPLIYPPEDIVGAATILRGGNSSKQAQAIELLDNLLTGELRRYAFPLFDDAPAADHFKKSLALLGLGSFDRNTAVQELLKQDDIWLQAATLMEIGWGELREFKGQLQPYVNSPERVLSETAMLALSEGSKVITEKNLTTIEKLMFLKSVDIFEHATVEQLGRIAGLTEEVHFEPGELIYKEGELGDTLYLLLRGRVLIERNSTVLRQIKESEAFGSLEVLDFHPRATTAKAVDHVHALKLKGQEFHDLLSLDIEMVEAVFRMLCDRIRRTLTLVT